MAPLGEAEFKDFITGEGKLWFRNNTERSSFESFDGKPVSYVSALKDDPRGVIVVFHGFTEYADKYLEFMYNFWERGYSVYVPELRGHGYSYRRVPENDRVDIDCFETYVEDMKTFMDKVVNARYPSGVRKLLFAHSMGGDVGTLFLEDHPGYFERAVLSSPMLKINYAPLSVWQARLLFVVSGLLRWNDKLISGQPGFGDRQYDFENSCCTSEERYRNDINLRIGDEHFHTAAGTYSWGRAAMRSVKKCLDKSRLAGIGIPVLVCRAGKETVVDPSGMSEFAEGCKRAELAEFPEAKHEIFNSTGDVLKVYYEKLFGFFGERAE